MEQITLVKNAIHRPDEPRHFMQFKFPDTTYTASVDGQEIARTSNALVLSEVGYAIYQPVIYCPRSDVEMSLLLKIDKSTHCPLKGDTDYFDFVGPSTRVSEIAWNYARPLDFAAKLSDYLAFDTTKVRVAAD